MRDAARRSRALDERAGLGHHGADPGDLRRAGPGAAGRARPEIADAIPGARFELLDPAAHLASVERPPAVNALIADHLSGERMTDSAYDDGMKVRREVLGDEHVDRAIERTTEFTAPFQDYITRAAWGGVWTRPGLDRRTRSAITLAVLTALGRENEIEMHVRGGAAQRADARRRSARSCCTPPSTPGSRRPMPRSPSPSGCWSRRGQRADPKTRPMPVRCW